MNVNQIDRHALALLLEAEDISNLTIKALTQLFQAGVHLDKSLPDGLCQIDPRNGNRILYVTKRSSRPHDNIPEETLVPAEKGDCPICLGKTTGVVDAADLSEGFTFINKNLFPVVFPFDEEDSDPGCGVRGMHFLQWTSSYHDKDWHNMPLADCVVVMRRTAALEKKLVETGDQVLILKNYGRLVGGSLVHGHQQIILTPLLPNRFLDNQRFLREKGETFSEFLLRENPPHLLVRDYGPAVLLVPYFMRRSLEMMLILKDSNRQYLHELSEEEMTAVAQGWQEAIQAIRRLMPVLGRETAYNITCHNGDGAGLYFEFLPYTQETGGLEHLGIYACQARPEDVAEMVRKTIKN